MSVKLIAIAEDQATGEYRAVIKFKKVDGTTGRLLQPKSCLRKPRELLSELENRGAKLPSDTDEALSIIAGLGRKLDRVPHWRYAATTGWYDNRSAFVHPNRVIGTTSTKWKLKSPLNSVAAHNRELKIAGKHKEWIRQVATPAQYSSRMILAICASFAAPLLENAGINSFGIHFWGPSKTGKSTALLAGASVVGFDTESELINFRTTDAAFGEVLGSFKDMIVPVNELGLLRGTITQQKQWLTEMSYLLGEGRNTTYSKLASISRSSSGLVSRAVLLSTGEKSIDELFAAAHESRMTGSALRWFDLRETQKNGSDIFDLYKSPQGSKRTDWIAATCRQIREGCRSNPGVTFMHFIKRIIRDQDDIDLAVSKLANGFARKQGLTADDLVARHLAKCFGLLGAAGIIAVRNGTVPWSEELVWKAVRRCFRQARRELRTEASIQQEGLKQLQKHLCGSSIIDLKTNPRPSKHAWRTSDGYRDQGNVIIRAKRFKGWFDDDRVCALVLQHLHDNEALKTKGIPPVSTRNGIVWAETQPTWPTGRRPRSIVIRASANRTA